MVRFTTLSGSCLFSSLDFEFGRLSFLGGDLRSSLEGPAVMFSIVLALVCILAPICASSLVLVHSCFRSWTHCCVLALARACSLPLAQACSWALAHTWALALDLALDLPLELALDLALDLTLVLTIDLVILDFAFKILDL